MTIIFLITSLTLLLYCQESGSLPPGPFIEKFNKIKTNGEILGFHVDEQFDALDSKPGFNHFQGIQRLKDTNYLLLTSNGDHSAQLHVVKLASRKMSGRFGSNLNADITPPEEDRIVLNYVISEKYNHAGGIQIVDNILAAPLENGVDSKILFFNMQEPENPEKLRAEILRKNKGAGSVAIYKERGEKERFVLLVKTIFGLDIYYSLGCNLDEADFELKYTWNVEDLRSGIAGDRHFGNYQNISAIHGIDGQVYLIGLHNNTTRFFRIFSDDYADLFRLDVGDKGRPALTKIAKKSFHCQKSFWETRYCNFDAGAGVYMDEQDRILIYAVADEPANGIVTFVEYSHHEK